MKTRMMKTLILFSVWRTDRSNAKFATFSSGKTDNARCRRAADILPPSLSGAESHDTAATDTSRLTPSAVDGLAGLKCSRKLTNYLIKLK